MSKRVVADLLVTGIGELLTMAGKSPKILDDAKNIGMVEDGAIAVLNGRIVWVGKGSEVKYRVRELDGCVKVDAEGKVVIPGFVDPHSHVAYAGDRKEEYAMRTRGVSYEEIVRSGGGIKKTVKDTREASDDSITSQTIKRLDRMLCYGTTTLEVKSGYCLNEEGEIRLLRLINSLSSNHPITIIPTLLAAHSVPEDYMRKRSDYVKLICDRIIPNVSSMRLANFNDVFVERSFFSADDAYKILKAGLFYGLKPRVHAEEFSRSGGSLVASKIKAYSADHLVFVEEEDMLSLAKAKVTAVLLPSSSLHLRIGKHAPGRKLIDLGVPLAIGTDASPAVPCLSMQIAIFLTCAVNGISLEEALVAATINSAHSLGVSDRVGSIEPGKDADFLILECDSYKELGYRFTENLVNKVYKRGKLVAYEGKCVYHKNKH